MRVQDLLEHGVAFPGVAGELQRRGAVIDLIRELGDNYELYHEFLAAPLAAQKRPEPDAFGTFGAYASAWADIHAIVVAEALLRRAAAARQHGRRIDDPPDYDDPPLVDQDDRLLPRTAKGEAVAIGLENRQPSASDDRLFSVRPDWMQRVLPEDRNP
jgi:hypothetical protein